VQQNSIRKTHKPGFLEKKKKIKRLATFLKKIQTSSQHETKLKVSNQANRILKRKVLLRHKK
jgi:hypothetical protein